jgi:Protein of unknown function (DUF1361)
VHLRRFPEIVYFDIVYITAMTFAGMVAGYASMELVHKYLNIHYHKRIGWIVIITVTVLSMIGVYLGRFLRFNTWDIWHNPWKLLVEVWQVLISNGSTWNIWDPTRLAQSKLYEVGAMGLWQFVLLYGSFFLLVYMYVYHTSKK